MKILFLCTHNACRSVLAEVIARELAGGRIATASAGSDPGGQVHPLTLAGLARHGYPTAGLASKGLADVASFAPDVVITVCDSAARETCPLWLGKAAKVHWGLPDPSRMEGGEQDRARAFDAVIATVESRVRALLAEPFESMDNDQLRELLQTMAVKG